VRILQLPQGYYHDLSAMALDAALTMFAEDDAAFLRKYPQCRPYHRPFWHTWVDVEDSATAPWGHEWYQVGADGILQRHSAHYDSSD
jgi:hypothetical protein